MDSILTSIKKLLGIPEEYEQFDMDIILHINSVFMILNQLGVGPAEMYRITDKNDKWLDFVTDYDDLDAVKSYMFLKVKQLFDPPQSSILMESQNRLIQELEWRLNVKAENKAVIDAENEKNQEY